MKKAQRSYVLKARGEKMAETRARIVEALMALHQEVGPSRTTVSAVAERAGVERLTVYRHFPDEVAMLAACSHRYFELNPPPDLSGLMLESDPVRRARRGLGELYAYFRKTAPMFEKVYRDARESAAVAEILARFDAYLVALADGLASGWSGRAPGRLRVTLRHASKFATWHSLESDGVPDGQKVGLMLEWLGASDAARA